MRWMTIGLQLLRHSDPALVADIDEPASYTFKVMENSQSQGVLAELRREKLEIWRREAEHEDREAGFPRAGRRERIDNPFKYDSVYSKDGIILVEEVYKRKVKQGTKVVTLPVCFGQRITAVGKELLGMGIELDL